MNLKLKLVLKFKIRYLLVKTITNKKFEYFLLKAIFFYQDFFKNIEKELYYDFF